jgi:hypothetical protein
MVQMCIHIALIVTLQLWSQVASLQLDLDHPIRTNTQLLVENSSKLLELKATEEDLLAAREEVIKVKKVLETIPDLSSHYDSSVI